MTFSLRQIRYFIATADAGKVSAAAANVSVSQSAITSAVKGLERSLGRKLFGLLQRRGLEGLKVRPCVHALRTGEPMMLHIPSTLEVMRESVLSMGLMTGPEMDDVLDKLHQHLARPDTLMISYAMIQVTGRVV